MTVTVRRSRRLRQRQSENDDTSIDSTPSLSKQQPAISQKTSTKQNQKTSKPISTSSRPPRRKPLVQLDPQTLKRASNQNKEKHLPKNSPNPNLNSSSLATSTAVKTAQQPMKKDNTSIGNKLKQLSTTSPSPPLSSQKNINNTPSQPAPPLQRAPTISPTLTPAQRIETPPGSSAYHATLGNTRVQSVPNPQLQQPSQEIRPIRETRPGSSADHARLASNSTTLPSSQRRNQFQTQPRVPLRKETPPGTSSQHANLSLNQPENAPSSSQVDEITPIHTTPQKKTPPGSSTFHASLGEAQNQIQPSRQRKRTLHSLDEFTTPTPKKRPSRTRKDVTEQIPITPSSPVDLDVVDEDDNQQEITPDTRMEMDYVPRIGRPRLSQTPTLVRGPRVVATYSRKRRLQQTGDVQIQLPSMKALGIQPETPTSGSEKDSEKSASSEWEASSDEEEDLESSEERPRKVQKKKNPQLDAFIKQQKGFWNEVDNIDLEEEFEF